MKAPGICPHCKKGLSLDITLGPVTEARAHGPLLGEREREPSLKQPSIPKPLCPDCGGEARLVCKESKARGPFRFLACTNTACAMSQREPPWIPGTFRWMNGVKEQAA